MMGKDPPRPAVSELSAAASAVLEKALKSLEPPVRTTRLGVRRSVLLHGVAFGDADDWRRVRLVKKRA